MEYIAIFFGSFLLTFVFTRVIFYIVEKIGGKKKCVWLTVI